MTIIIAMTGKKRTGKDTSASYIRNILCTKKI